MNILQFEQPDGTYQVIIQARVSRTEDESIAIDEFCENNHIFGQWERYHEPTWFGGHAQYKVVTFHNVTREQMIMINLALK